MTINAMSGTGWACTTLPTCSRTDLQAAGGSYPPITVSVNIAQGASSPLVNSVAVTLTGQTEASTANNAATDTTTLTPQADLAILKTDGVTTVTAGDALTYTIAASNAGPSNAPGTSVADTLPASLTATWICVGAGGGTCTAAGSGNFNDTVAGRRQRHLHGQRNRRSGGNRHAE